MAGIIVGSILGGMSIIALVAWLLLRKRKRDPKHGSETMAEMRAAPSGMSDKQVQHDTQYVAPHGWGNEGVYEMGAAQGSPAELDALPHARRG